MASLTIRNLDDELEARLRIRATKNGRSMEEEARNILSVALAANPSDDVSLVESLRRRIEPLGGVELEIEPRGPMRESIGLE